jgi:CDP-diacylglycerol--glycerol-3-phosphate 3-phosphatidyltransferase
MNPAGPDHVGDPVSRVSSVNVPNALTVARLLCVPVLIWCLSKPDLRWWAVVVFVVASATDFVDGAVARRYSQVTNFGKVADPIADKALTGVALIGLSILGDLWWWVTLVILVREVGITLLRMWVIRIGVIPASRGGKAKTVTQMIAISMLLAPVTSVWWLDAAYGVMAIALALTVVTGCDYVIRVVRMRSAA